MSVEVGEAQANIGINDTDNGHFGKVEALRQHLCADKDVDFAGLKRLDHSFVAALLTRDIAVPAGDTRPGKMRASFLFDSLRADAKWAVATAVTFRAAVFESPGAAAMMANEQRADWALHIEAHRNFARRAEGQIAAIATEDEAGGTAAINEEDGLLALTQGGIDRAAQRSRKDAAVACAKLLAHIDDGNCRQCSFGNRAIRCRSEALAQIDSLDRSDFGAVIGDEIGGSAPEDEAGSSEFGQVFGGVPGVVAGLWIDLLVAPFVLFIEHDQPEIRHGCEDRTARAHDEAGVTALNAVPLVVEFADGKLRMKHGERLGEAFAIASNGLGRERYFGDENDGSLALFEGMANEFEVDLGFSRTCDSMEECGSGVGKDRFQCRRLLGAEPWWVAVGEPVIREGVAFELLFELAEVPTRFEVAKVRGGGSEFACFSE